MLNRDSEIVICSRFVNCDLVIWTQPSGPLCLWQCFFFNLYFWSKSKPYLRVLSAYRPYQELSPKFHFRCFSSLSKQPQDLSVRLIPWFPWVLSGMPIAHGHSNRAFWFTHQRFHFHRAPLQCLGGCLLQKLRMPQETPPSYSFFTSSASCLFSLLKNVSYSCKLR